MILVDYVGSPTDCHQQSLQNNNVCTLSCHWLFAVSFYCSDFIARARWLR